MKMPTLPGAFWSGLLVLLMMLPQWMGDSFPNAVWVAPVAGLILIAVKVIEVVRSEVPAPPPGVAASDYPEQPSKTQRILWG